LRIQFACSSRARAAAIVLVLLDILTYRFFRRRARRVQNLQVHRIIPS